MGSLVSYEETETDTENYENNPLVPTESHSHVKVEHSPVKVENSPAPTTSQENVDKNRFPVLRNRLKCSRLLCLPPELKNRLPVQKLMIETFMSTTEPYYG